MVKNGLNLTGGLGDSRDFSAYLVLDTSLEAAETLATELQMRPEIYAVGVTDADTAFSESPETAGLDEVLAEIEGNPLPHTLNISPVEDASPAALAALAQELEANPAVDTVQIDTLWVERLNAILEFLRRVVLVATVMLVVGTLIIVGNTIRLDIQSRRDEIEVLKLLGASDGFVRRPFLYVGLWYGVAGGVLALLLLLIGGWVLSGPLERLLGLYDSGTAILGLDGATLLLVVLGGIAAGWGGAWSAVARHLSAIQPH